MQKNELYRLFHKRWTQQITKEEAGQLSTLMQDVGVREIHDEMHSIWLASNEYKPKTDFNAEAGLARFKNRIASEHNSSTKNRGPRIMRMKPQIVLLRVAAAVLFLCFVSFITYNYLKSATSEILTNNSDIQYVQLKDGTEVWLNVNSILSYPTYGYGDRKVKLKGEAYFQVAPDKSNPFTVSTTQADIVVIGTAFNVSAQSSKNTFSLDVDEGIVQLEYKDQKIKLEAGEQLTRSKGNETFTKSELNSLNAGAWRDNILRFQNSSLAQVFQDLEYYYQIKIDASGINSLDCAFTSPINRSVGDVIQALSAAYPDLDISGPDQRKYTIAGSACQ